MNPRSLPVRLGAWYALLVSATFIAVGACAYYGLEHYLHANLRDTLKRRSAQVEQILKDQPPDVGQAAIGSEIETRIAPEINNRFVRVSRSPGGVWYLSHAPADGSFDPLAISANLGTASNPSVPAAVLQDGQLMISSTGIHTRSGAYRVEMGVGTQTVEDALGHLTALLILLIPALIACAATGGYLLVNHALRPVDRLSRTAEQLSLQNLTLRLPVLKSGDALERLSISLNNMLTRLRFAVQTSRRFLADASHELRTPLTVIKGELQELSRTPALTERDLHERVGSVLEEVDRLEHLVSGLLALSRLDAGETRSDWVELDLAALARTTAEQMRLMAEDRAIALEIEAPSRTLIHGDSGRIKQIIVNLLHNAIRFTPGGGKVRLRVADLAEGNVLEVIDTGVGIPAAAIRRVFDRFYRVDDARSREDGGAGLGLSIVRAICKAHGATIEVESRLGHGSCFQVRFPKQQLPITAVEVPENDAADPEPLSQT
ncbi:MAG TPA: ATP-binding protein [Steroidobacteraceae bacterium]|nr:ATP-binding protein [Steroidobacteraceae bacterium]